MKLSEDHVDITTPSGPMRTFLVRPAHDGKFPGIVLFSEIFQVTGPILRSARLIAAQGYIVALPEIFHEFEAPGTPFPYTQEGTDKGRRYMNEKPLSAHDDDARAVLAHLKGLPECNGKLGSIGFCFGGLLSFRCAMDADVSAAACFYGSGIHKQSGEEGGNDSLARIAEIRGELLMVYGRQDPVIPQAGRDIVHRALSEAGTEFTWHEFNAGHAFIRDEGERYNPALAQICYAMTFELFQRKLYADQPSMLKD